MNRSTCQRLASKLVMPSAVATSLLLTAGMLLAAAVASMFHSGNVGAAGAQYTAGPDQYLTSQYAAGAPTLTKAKGVIKHTWNSYDWMTDAGDNGHWYGLITDADPPRWEVTMKTLQPVHVYGDGSAPPFIDPSWWYRSEALHYGYGQVFNAPLVWGGAWFHVGNAESDVDSVHWIGINSTHQIPIARKVKSSGKLTNVQYDSNGEPVYDEALVEVAGPGVIVALKSNTNIARLVHRVFVLEELQFRHHVELDVNQAPTDAGQINVEAIAWDDGVAKVVDAFQFN